MLAYDEIYHADALKGLAHISGIDLTVTSPPYGYGKNALRTYGGHGLNWTKEKFQLIAKQLYRVTRHGGAVCWVVQDKVIKGEISGDSWQQAFYFRSLGFRLQEWICINKIPPFPHTPIVHRRHNTPSECIFVFSKGRLKTFNPRTKPNKPASVGKAFKSIPKNRDGSKEPSSLTPISAIGYRSAIWDYTPNQSNDYSQHPDRMRPQLARDIILTWSNHGDVVLDPFAGSGTTLSECIKAGRNYIGFEINSNYVKTAKQRIDDTYAEVAYEMEEE